MGIEPPTHLLINDDRFESHEARDRRFLEITRRVAKNDQVGWPVLALTVGLAVMAIAILVYLFICPSLLG
jgi:hypothetical protein